MNIGLGVMIRALAYDNGQGVLVNAIGKTISLVKLIEEDNSLHVHMMDGTSFKVKDEGQSCCEYRYMSTDDKLSDFSGAVLMGMEIKSCDPLIDTIDGCEEIQFLGIQTSKGEFIMTSHNEHNGYYGGFSITITDTTAKGGE